jgi:hypothetical protein
VPPITTTVRLLREQVHQAHQRIEGQLIATAMRPRSSARARRQALASYAHAACVEDATVSLLLQNKPPLFRARWGSDGVLGRELAAVRSYAHAVHASTDVFLRKLAPADLERCVELTDVGVSKRSVRWVLTQFVLGHTAKTCDAMLAATRTETRARGSRSGPHRNGATSPTPPQEGLAGGLGHPARAGARSSTRLAAEVVDEAEVPAHSLEQNRTLHIGLVSGPSECGDQQGRKRS